MKRFLLWSFERGSIQYDVICVVILAFIFITPQTFFDDRPDWMRIRAQVIRQARDDDGNPVWVVPKVKTEQAAVDRLKLSLGQAVTVSRAQPVYDPYGMLVQYAIWVAR
ncbi:MAG TPA: hypothetical protein VGK48_23465 [Terriglobia bacterium]|jgi:hypothetical protein